MNSFLFLQSTRIKDWQELIASGVPTYQNSNTAIYSEQLQKTQNGFVVINSPINKVLSTNDLSSFAIHDPSFLIGLEAAILSYDSVTQKTLIARDFPGTETIYYYHTSEDLIISDNFKAFQDLKLTKDLSKLKTLEYLTAEFSNSNLTLWEKILKVLPGEIIEFENFQIKSKTKLHPKDLLNLAPSKADLNQTLQHSLQKYHPQINAELSGGLDSMTLADLTWKLLGSESLKSYSILFPEMICDETLQINNFLQLRPHHNQKLNFSIIEAKELQALASKIAYFPDYPNSLSSVSYLKNLANKNQEILIDGFGGDQLFNLWKTKKEFTSFDYLKSKLLNDLKLRKIFRKRVFPWININAECQLLTHLNSHSEIYPKNLKTHQLAMLQQLFSSDFSEYLESACLVAKAHGAYRSHPYLRKEIISLALNLNLNDLAKKRFLGNNLQQSLGANWKGAKKADFSETFIAYAQLPDYLQMILNAKNRFKELIDLQSFKDLAHLKNRSSKQVLVNWNLIGLEMIIASSHTNNLNST